nr:hypothetical protein [uncultured Flavobacterium sp.]
MQSLLRRVGRVAMNGVVIDLVSDMICFSLLLLPNLPLHNIELM